LRPFTSRVVLSALVAVLAVALLAACGDEEDTQALTFTISEQGKGSKITGPKSAETGVAEITLRNDNRKREADLQLIRVEGDRSAEEVIEGLEKAMKGQPFPGWFFGGGGVGTSPAGQSSTVTQVLEPGTYYAIDTEGSLPDPKSLAAVEVSGEASDEEVEDDATVSAFEYGFEADGLDSGKTEIAFENSGTQPHHLLISEITGDNTAQDVEQAFKSEKGPPPLSQKNSQSTAVIEAGETQLVTLDLKPGRYALYCFITDRQGGKPHALKGMVDEVEVQ
jgi:Copper binding proteins, plastocyanin/azurin family